MYSEKYKHLNPRPELISKKKKSKSRKAEFIGPPTPYVL